MYQQEKQRNTHNILSINSLDKFHDIYHLTLFTLNLNYS
jgi:hypothetical protein